METVKLACRLTDGEVLERATEAAKLSYEAFIGEAKLAVDTKAAKTEIGRLRANVAELQEQVRTRSELRDVEVEYRYDENRASVDSIRCDTGEVFSSRPMTADELREARQQKLPGIGRGRRGGEA